MDVTAAASAASDPSTSQNHTEILKDLKSAMKSLQHELRQDLLQQQRHHSRTVGSLTLAPSPFQFGAFRQSWSHWLGSLLSGSSASNRSDTSTTPSWAQHVPRLLQLDLRTLGCIRERLPAATYVLLATAYDDFNGRPLRHLHVSVIDSSRDDSTYRSIRHFTVSGGARHSGKHHAAHLDLSLNAPIASNRNDARDSMCSMILACPPANESHASQLILFELFRVRGARQQYDECVAWGAVPMHELSRASTALPTFSSTQHQQQQPQERDRAEPVDDESDATQSKPQQLQSAPPPTTLLMEDSSRCLSLVHGNFVVPMLRGEAFTALVRSDSTTSSSSGPSSGGERLGFLPSAQRISQHYQREMSNRRQAENGLFPPNHAADEKSSPAKSSAPASRTKKTFSMHTIAVTDWRHYHELLQQDLHSWLGNLRFTATPKPAKLVRISLLLVGSTFGFSLLMRGGGVQVLLSPSPLLHVF